MSQKIIFIEDERDVPEGLRENAKIIAMNSNVMNRLKVKGIPSDRFSDFRDYIGREGIRKINQKSSMWLKRWSEKRFRSLGNKNFKELMTHRGVSLWWFANLWMYYHPIHKETIQNAIMLIEIVDSATKRESPKEILILQKSGLLRDIISDYARSKKIPIRHVKQGPYPKAYSYLKDNAPYMLEWLKMKKFTFRSIASKIIYFGHKPKLSERKFLMTSYVIYAKKDKDPWIDPLISEITRRGFSHVNADIDQKANLGIVDLVLRRKNHVPFEFYYTWKIRQIVKKKRKEFEDMLKILENNPEFKDSLSYTGVRMSEVLKKRLRFMLKKRYPEAVMFIELFDRIIKEEKPSYVYAMDEPNIFGRSCVTASKLNNVPVLDAQFGMILDGKNGGSYEYSYLKGEISKEGRIDAPFCPAPDKFAVYSKRFYDILVKKGNYPQEKVVITGPPRYDPLFDKIKSFDRKEICSNLGIDPKSKVVVFCTQPEPDNEIMARVLMDAVSKIKNLKLIIKMHPRDRFYGVYKRIDKELNAGALISKDMDLHKAIFISDVMITKYSTSAVEAAILDKPLIILNLTSRSDVGGYVKAGVAVKAYRGEELKKAIIDILYNKNITSKLRSHRKKFVEDMVYKTDGKASQRVIDSIIK